MFEYFSKEGEYSYKNVYEGVDLDYFNIRHWRELYSLLEKETSKGVVVHLKIVPLFTDVI